MWTEPDDNALRELLRATSTVAVVGVSPDPLRPSNEVYHYLGTASDYQLYPVNPMIDRLVAEVGPPVGAASFEAIRLSARERDDRQAHA